MHLYETLSHGTPHAQLAEFRQNGGVCVGSCVGAKFHSVKQTDLRENLVAENIDSIARAIGLIVLQWGVAEQSFDLLVTLLREPPEAEHYAKHIPIMLEPKIKFVRRCLAERLELSSCRIKVETLLERFAQLSELRNDLVHSAVASISPSNGAFAFSRLNLKEDPPIHRTVLLETEAYPELIDQFIELARCASDAVTQVLAIYDAKG